MSDNIKGEFDHPGKEEPVLLIPRQSQKVGIIVGGRRGAAMRAAALAATDSFMFGAGVSPVLLKMPEIVEDAPLSIDGISKPFIAEQRIYEMVASRINAEPIQKRSRQVAVMLNRSAIALNLFPDKTKAGHATTKLIRSQGVQTTIHRNGIQVASRSLDELAERECAMDLTAQPVAVKDISKIGYLSGY